jgi:tRNA G18 (ribose-2'-O)-methylase SpoU
MRVGLQIIENIVCKHYEIEPHDFIKHDRQKEISEARHVFHYLARKYNKATLHEIGQWSNRHHTTVLHSTKTIKDLLETENKFNEFVSKIEAEIIEASNILNDDKSPLYDTSFRIAKDVMSCRTKDELFDLIAKLTPVL